MTARDVGLPCVVQRSTQLGQWNGFPQIGEIGETGNVGGRGQRPPQVVHGAAGCRSQLFLGQVAGLADSSDVLAETPCHRHVGPQSVGQPAGNTSPGYLSVVAGKWFQYCGPVPIREWSAFRSLPCRWGRVARSAPRETLSPRAVIRSPTGSPSNRGPV